MTLSVMLEMNDGSYQAMNDDDIKNIIVWHKSKSLPVAMVDRNGKIHKRPSVYLVRNLKGEVA